MNQQINIESLYNSLVGKFNIENRGSYEVIYPSGIEIKVFGNKYVKLVAVSRHKTSKHIVEVSVESSKGIDKVKVTTDHVCMVYNDDHFFENVQST